MSNFSYNYPKLTQGFKLLLCLVFVLSFFVSCGGKNSSGGGGQPPVFVPPDRRPKDEFNLQSLNLDRLLRRITLDLTGRLPTKSDRDYVSGSMARMMHLAGIYTHSDEFVQHFSRLHRYIWRLDPANLPDIERFIAEGDTALNAELDNDLRRKITEEPLNTVRFITASGLPFEQMFATNISIIHPDVADFWGMLSGSSSSPNSALTTARYQDNRPSIGILSQQGFLASVSNSGQQHGGGFNYSLLSRLLCNEFHSASAHDFSKLSNAEMANLTTSKGDDPRCAGCHLQLDGTRHTFRPFNQGDTFGTWAVYSSPSTSLRGHYAANDFVGLNELSYLMAKDPRIHRCHLQRLAETMQQRAFVYPQDIGSISFVIEVFNRHQRTFQETIKALLSLDDYKLAPISSSLDSTALQHLSGKRFLTSDHWRSIIEQWGFDSSEFPITSFLDPGKFDHSSQKAFHPASPYWHASNKLAHHLSHAIVMRELANNSLSVARRILARLPDGHSAGTSSSIVQEQITLLWNELTGDSQTPGDAMITNLYQLWTAIEDGTATAAKTKEAWQAVLLAILLSPQFLSY